MTIEIDTSTSAVLAAPATADVQAALEQAWSLHVPLSDLPPISSAVRLSALEALIGHNDGLDAVLVTNLNNIRALTGFTGSSARLLVSSQTAHLLTDARYEERAAEEIAASGARVQVVVRRTQPEQQTWLRGQIATSAHRTVGLEAASLSWADHDALATEIPDVTWVAVTNLVERLRRTKSLGEIARTARAAAIADAALAQVLPLLSGAVAERAFQRALDSAMIALGADAVSFDTIVASGPNASRPHHETGARIIAEGDEVICDFGALVDGYHSDMTRTIYIGEPSKAQQRHFAVVRAAHDEAAAAITPGISCRALDRVAREVCDAAGWGERFVHGLGHGTGLLIHELPWLGATSRNAICDGDLVTIEPGIYLPGSGGVRIEDLYVVTAEGPIALTRAPVDIVV